VGSLLIAFGTDGSLRFQLVVGEGRIGILGLRGIRSVFGSPLMELGFVEGIEEAAGRCRVGFLEARCSVVEDRNSVS